MLTPGRAPEHRTPDGTPYRSLPKTALRRMSSGLRRGRSRWTVGLAAGALLLYASARTGGLSGLLIVIAVLVGLPYLIFSIDQSRLVSKGLERSQTPRDVQDLMESRARANGALFGGLLGAEPVPTGTERSPEQKLLPAIDGGAEPAGGPPVPWSRQPGSASPGAPHALHASPETERVRHRAGPRAVHSGVAELRELIDRSDHRTRDLVACGCSAGPQAAASDDPGHGAGGRMRPRHGTSPGGVPRPRLGSHGRAPAPAAHRLGSSAASTSFWAELTPVERSALTTAGRVRRFAPGGLLFREGEPARHVMVIRSGWTKVFVGAFGAEHDIALRNTGDLLGERAALRESIRSASVIALDTVEVLELRTPDFAAFLSAHPRVLPLVEQEIYGRLTERAPPRSWSGDPTDRVPGTAPRWTGQNCTILMVDIAGFSRGRVDADRRAIRREMYDMLLAAFEHGAVPWGDCHCEDRGDGALIIVPPGVPTATLVEPLLAHLAADLGRYNRRVAEQVRIQLRTVLHVGPVVSDPEGVTGEAIIHASRLLDSRTLKRRLAEQNADLAFICSDFVYQTVIAHLERAPIPALYERVNVRQKEARLPGWITLIGPTS